MVRVGGWGSVKCDGVGGGSVPSNHITVVSLSPLSTLVHWTSGLE